ncbi:MAG TPA: TerB family tellurite resistance protein [Candidatus Nitrosotenuis sp.]|jgi:uncharacterized tellurite resistance protein B-like protein|nr:TerB family tellurite resistance protein [Candidatus Nitrosotenuis sp.]
MTNEECGLLVLLRWSVEELAGEAEAAARWINERYFYKGAEVRARLLLGELSHLVTAAGSPRSFAASLPGVGPRPQGLTPEAAYLAYRMAKMGLYVEAIFHSGRRDPQEQVERLLLVMGVALGLPRVKDALVYAGRTHPHQIIRHLTGNGPGWLARALQEVLEERLRSIRDLPWASALRGVFEYLTLGTAAQAAIAYCNDLLFTRQDLQMLETSSADQAAATLALLAEVARADEALRPQEEALVAAVRDLLPAVDEQALELARRRLEGESLADIFPYAEEQKGLLETMLAVACADGVLDPREEDLVRRVAARFELNSEATEQMLEKARSRLAAVR